jgi:hypothetical protein
MRPVQKFKKNVVKRLPPAFVKVIQTPSADAHDMIKPPSTLIV